MKFPQILPAEKLKPGIKRLFIGAYGFEDRSLGWVNHQENQGAILSNALVFRYRPSKGKNRIHDLRTSLSEMGVSAPRDTPYNMSLPHLIENTAMSELESEIEEVVLDISAMTKFLILICLCKMISFSGTVRIVYSEAEDYVPTEDEYKTSKEEIERVANFPSYGFQSIVRAKCLISSRMQGQPVTVIAFTSFNEQLVRHTLGTISPHRLLFISGRPLRSDYAWREYATQEIHKRLINAYPFDNLDDRGRLTRVASTMKYAETITQIDDIYKKYGTYERIICSATGSKMQTVGLFFSKVKHPDIQIEYPAPDGHFKGMSRGVRKIHEIKVPQFSKFLEAIRRQE